MHALFHQDLKESSVGASKKKNLFLYNVCYASICSFAVSMGKTTFFLSQYPSVSFCLSCAMQPTAATSKQTMRRLSYCPFLHNAEKTAPQVKTQRSNLADQTEQFLNPVSRIFQEMFQNSSCQKATAQRFLLVGGATLGTCHCPMVQWRALSPHSTTIVVPCVGFLQVLQFPSTVQIHAGIRLIGCRCEWRCFFLCVGPAVN